MASQGTRSGLLRAATALCLALAAGPGAGEVTSDLRNPTVVFATPGDQLVTLTVCNAAGCDAVSRTVTVLDPLPSATAAAATPQALPQGALVQLAGAGKGQPVLVLGWRVLSTSQATVATLPGAAATWDTTGFPPGEYTVLLEVSNALGTATSLPIPVTLGPGPFLFADGFEAGTAPWALAVP